MSQMNVRTGLAVSCRRKSLKTMSDNFPFHYEFLKIYLIPYLSSHPYLPGLLTVDFVFARIIFVCLCICVYVCIKIVVTRATTISKVYFNRSNIFTDVRR
jgi:hypothetical protein